MSPKKEKCGCCCSHLVYFLFFICVVSFIFCASNKFDLILFDLIFDYLKSNVTGQRRQNDESLE